MCQRIHSFKQGYTCKLIRVEENGISNEIREGWKLQTVENELVTENNESEGETRGLILRMGKQRLARTIGDTVRTVKEFPEKMSTPVSTMAIPKTETRDVDSDRTNRFSTNAASGSAGFEMDSIVAMAMPTRICAKDKSMKSNSDENFVSKIWASIAYMLLQAHHTRKRNPMVENLDKKAAPGTDGVESPVMMGKEQRRLESRDDPKGGGGGGGVRSMRGRSLHTGYLTKDGGGGAEPEGDAWPDCQANRIEMRCWHRGSDTYGPHISLGGRSSICGDAERERRSILQHAEC
ncbi:hypothetical protein FGB62_5g418 [Gracilaria domingensis]|nr:hypothetical protein FGB62_5g418 [Gracilaria domingensis]